MWSVCRYRWRNFNPRPPRGGRLKGPRPLSGKGLFQSTPSARRATCSSILSSTSEIHFNPRPPRGGRLKGGG